MLWVMYEGARLTSHDGGRGLGEQRAQRSLTLSSAHGSIALLPHDNILTTESGPQKISRLAQMIIIIVKYDAN